MGVTLAPASGAETTAQSSTAPANTAPRRVTRRRRVAREPVRGVLARVRIECIRGLRDRQGRWKGVVKGRLPASQRERAEVLRLIRGDLRDRGQIGRAHV